MPRKKNPDAPKKSKTPKRAKEVTSEFICDLCFKPVNTLKRFEHNKVFPPFITEEVRAEINKGICLEVCEECSGNVPKHLSPLFVYGMKQKKKAETAKLNT